MASKFGQRKHRRQQEPINEKAYSDNTAKNRVSAEKVYFRRNKVNAFNKKGYGKDISLAYTGKTITRKKQ